VKPVTDSVLTAVLTLCVLAVLPATGYSFHILQELIVNYSDFSEVRSIAVGYDYVYFGTTNGIIRYHIEDDKWGIPLTGKDGLEGRDILKVQVSSDDEYIWAKTDFGIYEYRGISDYWLPVDEIPPSTNTISRHLAPDPLYFPPEGYNYMSDGYLIDFEGRRFPVTDVVDDGWGNFWIGIRGLGAAKSRSANYHLELLPYGLRQENVATMFLDDSLLWLCGSPKYAMRPGLTEFDWRENQFDYIDLPAEFVTPNSYIFDLYANGDDIFLATDYGVVVIDKETRTVRDHFYRSSGIPDENVLAVAANGDTVFVGTHYGLGLLKRYQDTVEARVETYLPSLSVNCLEQTDEALWIGTSRGVYRLDYESARLGRLKTPEVSGSGEVFDIELAGEQIWVASENNLVSIDLETAEVMEYPEVNGYGGATAVAVADTLVAVAVNQGMLLINTGKKRARYLYTVNDGLPSHYISDLIFDGDYLWIGSNRGLTRFWYKNPRLPQ